MKQSRLRVKSEQDGLGHCVIDARNLLLWPFTIRPVLAICQHHSHFGLVSLPISVMIEIAVGSSDRWLLFKLIIFIVSRYSVQICSSRQTPRLSHMIPIYTPTIIPSTVNSPCPPKTHTSPSEPYVSPDTLPFEPDTLLKFS